MRMQYHMWISLTSCLSVMSCDELKAFSDAFGVQSCGTQREKLCSLCSLLFLIKCASEETKVGVDATRKYPHQV